MSCCHCCSCSYIAEMCPDEEDAPLPRGAPLGADASGALYYALGGDSGADMLPNQASKHTNT